MRIRDLLNEIAPVGMMWLIFLGGFALALTIVLTIAS